MRTLNLGILAHVDAGKTTLTERLLYLAGVIDEIGSVDTGNTQTDSLNLERQRGITIKSNVVSFVVENTTINLIDTPGHPDFIAEVERVLNVLDGAVLMISTVEGVQAQTRLLMRTLQRLHIPTVIFGNKIDRKGAQYKYILWDITRKLTPAIIPMGSVSGLGSHSAGVTPFGATDTHFASGLVDLLADHDDALLAAYVNDEASVTYHQLRRKLAAQTRQMRTHPVFFGSAITGVGVDALITGITEFLPAAEGDANGPVSGTVFKIDRGPAGEKIAYARMLTGTIRVRDRLRFGRDSEGKVTAISVFDRGPAVQHASVVAGQIGKLSGLDDVRIGDTIGVSPTASYEHHFAPPTLETVVVPCRPSDKGSLRVALAQIAEQDPLIDLRQDDFRQELFVSLYGEVQKEIIQATLANDFSINVEFRETATICIERPIGTGEAVEILHAESNPFLATVGLRIEPAAFGTGVEFHLASEVLGTMPLAFFKAVQDTVYETLHQGAHGWQVADCTITMTHSGYAPRQSHAHQGFSKSMSSTGEDFRKLTPLVLMSALKHAGTVVCEPMHRFHLEIPEDTLGTLLPAMARLGAVPRTQGIRGLSYTLEGEIPATQIHDLQQQLPRLTRGEGVLECTFDRYEPVRGAIPTRQRTDHNPLNRKGYLLHVLRQV